MNENNEKSNIENQEYSDYGRIDLTKENIGPETNNVNLNIQSNSNYYSEELPFPTEKIDLTREDIPVVINGNSHTEYQPIETNDYNVKEGISQVYIPEEPQKKLPKKVVKILLIVFFILSLIEIGILYYNNMPKQLFLNGISNMYSKINDSYYSPISNSIKKSTDSVINVSNKTNFLVETNDRNYLETVKMLNGLEINLDVKNDSKSNLFVSNIELLSNEESIINSGLYSKNSEIYLELKNIFSKYIKFSSNNSMASSIDEKNIQESFDALKKIYLSELKESDFTKIKEELTIGGKSVEVWKVTLSLSADRFKELQGNVNDKILSDEKITNTLCKIFNVDKSSLKKYLDKVKNTLVLKQLEFDVYLNKKEPIKVDFVIDEISLVLVELNEYLDFTYKNDNNIICSLTIENENIYLKLDNIVIEFSKSDENKYDFNIKNNTNVINGTLTSSKKEISDKEVVNTMVISMNINHKISLIINNEKIVKIIDKVNVPDLNNYVNYEDLTDEEINVISEKIINNLDGVLGPIFNGQMLGQVEDEFSKTDE